MSIYKTQYYSKNVLNPLAPNPYYRTCREYWGVYTWATNHWHELTTQAKAQHTNVADLINAEYHLGYDICSDIARSVAMTNGVK